MEKDKKRKAQLVSSRIEVECPKWLQRRMLKNLHDSAHNKINPVSAKSAEKILAAIKYNTDEATSQSQTKTEKATDAHTQSNERSLKPITKVSLGKGKFMAHVFSKCVNSLRNFMSLKRCLQATRG